MSDNMKNAFRDLTANIKGKVVRDYQTKLDNNLTTESKMTTGAINELHDVMAEVELVENVSITGTFEKKDPRWKLVTDTILQDDINRISILNTDSSDSINCDELVFRMQLSSNEDSVDLNIYINDKLVCNGGNFLSIEPKYIMVDLKKIGQYIVGNISKLNFDFNMTDGNTYIISNNNSNLLNESDRITKITIATSDDSKTISANSKIQIFGRKIY